MNVLNDWQWSMEFIDRLFRLQARPAAVDPASVKRPLPSAPLTVVPANGHAAAATERRGTMEFGIFNLMGAREADKPTAQVFGPASLLPPSMPSVSFAPPRIESTKPVMWLFSPHEIEPSPPSTPPTPAVLLSPPLPHLLSAAAVLSGTGTVTARLSAYSLSLKLAFSLMLTSRRVRPSSFTIGSTLNGRLMPSCAGLGFVPPDV